MWLSKKRKEIDLRYVAALEKMVWILGMSCQA
jgi:hypothetical protein